MYYTCMEPSLPCASQPHVDASGDSDASGLNSMGLCHDSRGVCSMRPELFLVYSWYVLDPD